MFCSFFFKIRIPHPSHPSTRINVQVPNLGIHFSPAIYGKIMELLNIFYQSAEISDDNTFLQTGHMPWDPPDLASDARILAWRVCIFYLSFFKILLCQ